MERLIALDTSKQLSGDICISEHGVKADWTLSFPDPCVLLCQSPHLTFNLVHCQPRKPTSACAQLQQQLENGVAEMIEC